MLKAKDAIEDEAYGTQDSNKESEDRPGEKRVYVLRNFTVAITIKGVL